MVSQKNRIEWIDHFKALGIILVVLAHHADDIPGWALKYIYSFHVPLFFFLSGLVYRPERHPGIKSLILHKAKTLLLPYFMLSFLTYGIWGVLAPFRSGEPSLGLAEILEGIAGIVISANGIIWMAHNSPLWFLTCLFVVECWFHMLNSLRSGANRVGARWIVPVILLVLSVLGYLTRVCIPFRLPWGLDTALTGIVIFGVGVASQSKLRALSPQLTVRNLVVIFAGGVTGFILAQENDFVNMTFNKIGNYFLFYAAGFSSLAFCALISKTIPKNGALEFLGRNSLTVLALHLPAYIVIRGMEKGLGLGFVPQTKWDFFFRATVYSIIQILVLLPAIHLINRRARFLIGWR